MAMAQRGTFGGVLEGDGVAGEEDGHAGTEQLPEGKIPNGMTARMTPRGWKVTKLSFAPVSHGLVGEHGGGRVRQSSRRATRIFRPRRGPR